MDKVLKVGLLIFFVHVWTTAQDQKEDPREQYVGRLAKIYEKLANEHYSLGDFLDTSKMHKWARAEYNKAIGLVSDHEKARGKLGYKKDTNGWVSDPSIPIKVDNEGDEDKQDKVYSSYRRKVELFGKSYAGQFLSLASFCKKNNLLEEADLAYKKAVEYEPDNKEARKALGFVREGETWLSKFEKGLRDQIKKDLPNAEKGSESKDQTEVEQGLGLKHNKRKSTYFLVESPHLKQEVLGKIIQVSELTYSIYNQLFDQKAGFLGSTMELVVLQSKDQHQAYIDRFTQYPENEKKLVKEMFGAGHKQNQAECWQGNLTEIAILDFSIHKTCHFLVYAHTRGYRPWLSEGLSYYFTRLIQNTAGLRCVRFEGTSSGSGRDFSDPANWSLIIREWTQMAGDPDINAVIKSSLNDMNAERTVKAWSIIDFLIQEHKDKFIKFLNELAYDQQDTGEKALKKIFDWTLEDLDTNWKNFARRTY